MKKDDDLGLLFHIGIDKYLRIKDPELLINHSCDPNTGFLDYSTLFFLWDIQKDEEITFDYSTVGTDGWEMDFSCGEKTCRDKIKDFKYLPEELKEKCQDITPEWVKVVSK